MQPFKLNTARHFVLDNQDTWSTIAEELKQIGELKVVTRSQAMLNYTQSHFLLMAKVFYSVEVIALNFFHIELF